EGVSRLAVLGPGSENQHPRTRVEFYNLVDVELVGRFRLEARKRVVVERGFQQFLFFTFLVAPRRDSTGDADRRFAPDHGCFLSERRQARGGRARTDL